MTDRQPTTEERKKIATDAAIIANYSATHPDPDVRALVPIMHDLINSQLDQIVPKK